MKTRLEKALEIWNNMNPSQRLVIMKACGIHQYRSMKAKLRACLHEISQFV